MPATSSGVASGPTTPQMPHTVRGSSDEEDDDEDEEDDGVFPTLALF
jgi:hypothetical protein